MCKWWWRWVPGLHARWKTEKRRAKALSFIDGERLAVEQMWQRPRSENREEQTPLFNELIKKIKEIEARAATEPSYDLLGDLMDDAEKQSQFRAYLCPREELWMEGSLAIALLEEWGVPKSIVSALHKLLDTPLKSGQLEPVAARGALRSIFEEVDSWRDYTSEYESTMERYAGWLFGTTILLILTALLCVHWSCRFPLLVVICILLMGIAGSCVSVLSRMPQFEVRLSKELDAYKRRIMLRVAIGIAASIVGCAMLGWGVVPISFQGHSFADALCLCAGCSSHGGLPCTVINALVLLAVPMLFGFSERALTWLEHRMFAGTIGTRDL